MDLIAKVQKLNQLELEKGLVDNASWHEQYKDSAYIFIGGLPFELTEGDIICIFSQYGEVVDVNLIRDKETGKSKGYAFLAYEDQRSTILSVDNLTGMTVLGRMIRVDHVSKYKIPKKKGSDNVDEVDVEYLNRRNQIMPKHLRDNQEHSKDESSEASEPEINIPTIAHDSADALDPMREYFLEKKRKKSSKKDKKEKKAKKKERVI